VTSATTSAAEVLRGAGAWLWYLDLGQPWVRSGFTLVSEPAAIVATAALAAAGLAGLAHRDVPERRFLVGSLVVGVIVIGAAYAGPAGGVAAGAVRDLLADPLAPLRNVHKAAPVVLLPLALGLSHLVGRLPVPSRPRPRVALRAAAGLAAGAALVLAALPAARGELTTAGSFDAIPGAWRDAAAFLDRQAGESTALVLPAAPFTESRWGRPLDEPLEALGTGRWAARSLIPLGGLGSTRLLDGIEERIVAARASPGLRDVLDRAGVRYVLVRRDLDWRRTGSPAPDTVRAGLRAAGLHHVAAFGPLDDPLVEAFDVGRPAPPVAAYPQSGLHVVSGGPESVLQLADRGLLGEDAAILAADVPGGSPPPAWDVTDGLERRATDFGLVHDAWSYVLGRDEHPAGSGSVRQLLEPGWAGHEATAVTTGVRAVRASSYGSWLRALPELAPANAFDGHAASAWVAGAAGGSRGEWVEADLGRSVDLAALRIRLLRDGPWRPRITAVTVTTDAGSATGPLLDTEAAQPLLLVPGLTRRVRVTIAGVTGGAASATSAGIRDVLLGSGLAASRYVEPPQEPELMAAGTVPTLVFSRAAADPQDLLRSDEEPRLQRTWRLPAPARLRLTGTATPAPGPALDRLLTPSRGLRVSASSSWHALPRWRAGNAVDGSRRTVWFAAPAAPLAAAVANAPSQAVAQSGGPGQRLSPVAVATDPHPRLVLRWPQPRRLRSLRIVPAPGVGSRPSTVRIGSPAGAREVAVDAGRTVRFPALRTDTVSVTFPHVTTRYAAGADGRRTALPVAVAELDFPALRSERVIALPPEAVLRRGCSSPIVEVDGRRYATRLTATAGELVGLRPLPFTLCTGHSVLALGPGRHWLADRAGSPFAVGEATLAPPRGPVGPAAPHRAVGVVDWGDQKRTVRIAPGPAAFLAVRQNANDGWQATLDGHRLTPVRLDGWQQGYAVPAGAGGTVTLEFAPQRTYRVLLVIGAALALLLPVLALVPERGPASAPATLRQALPRLAGGAPASRRWRTLALAVAATAAVALVSWPAAAAVPLLLVLARFRPRWMPWLAASAFLAGALVTAIARDPQPGAGRGAFGTAAQVLAAIAPAAVLAAAAQRRRPA
jgi:arabinofuranan 3-O-arabinosyltransferase